jgi:hypothetical protein
MSELRETLAGALAGASQTPRGQRALAGHDEDFQVEVKGHEPIHVGIAGRQLTVNAGPSPRQEPMRFTRVQLEEDTLRAILAGRTSPLDAMEQGKLFLRTRLYGGALITILLRAAYDQAREQSLERALSSSRAS